MANDIEVMLRDMRLLRDSLQHSLVQVDNVAIQRRVAELTKQIEAVEALQADAMRYRGLRTCALESDDAKASAIDATLTQAFSQSIGRDRPTPEEFDGHIDAALAAVAELYK